METCELIASGATPETARAKTSPTAKWRRLAGPAKLAVAVLITTAIAGALWKCWPSILALSGRVDLRWAWLAMAMALVYRVLNAAGWGLVLRALGHPLPVLQGVRLWLVAETMRWLPGSVWGFCSRVYQAQRAGVPASAASLSMPLELAITVVAWGVAALVGGEGILHALASWIAKLPLHPGWSGVLLAVGLPSGAGILLWRFPHNRFTRKATGYLNDLRTAARSHPKPGNLVFALVWFTGLCLLNGLGFYAVLAAFHPPSLSLGTVIGINAVGWLMGFFAIFSPGGLGVREGGMAALLTPLVPLDIALGSVVLWRVIQIIAEVACLGPCYLRDPGLLSRKAAPAVPASTCIASQ